MGEISNPERATYFVAYGPNGTVHTGVTEPGQVTTTGQPSLESTTEENEYIGILNTVATQFPSLPAAGTPLKAGEIYSWNGGAVMVRQDHIRTEHDPDTVPALFIVHRLDDGIDWIAGEQVYVGTRRTYNAALYEAIQAHVTQLDWTPPAAPALWKIVEEGGGGGSTWVDTGATVTQLVAAGVYRVSIPLTGILAAGQAIRLGTAETVFTAFWSGFGDYLIISPHVTAANGDKVWKFA